MFSFLTHHSENKNEKLSFLLGLRFSSETNPALRKRRDAQPHGQCLYLDVQCTGTLVQKPLNGSAQAERLVCNNSILVAPVISQTKPGECLFVPQDCNPLWTERTTFPLNATSNSPPYKQTNKKKK